MCRGLGKPLNNSFTRSEQVCPLAGYGLPVLWRNREWAMHPLGSGCRRRWRQLVVSSALIVTGLVPCAQAHAQWWVCFREDFLEEATSELSLRAE